jgi:hypothetical protein
LVAELPGAAAGCTEVIGACIWKLVKNGVSRYSCRRATAVPKRGKKLLDYAELFFLYVVPEV